MKPRMYHNPRCSKSRATRALLEAEGIDVDIVEYLETPPDAETLTRLLRKLDLPASALLRTGEADFKEAGVDPETAGEAALIDLLTRKPRIMQRPIVEVDDAARIGRPPERVLELFE